MITITVSTAALAKLNRPVNGSGGFQSLLRKLKKQLNGNQLTLDATDVERLIRYSVAYGEGGFQRRTSKVSGRKVVRKKKVAKKR